MNNTLGETISKMRKEKNLTQSELAEKLLCSRELISLIETNRRSISNEFVASLSTILDFNFIHYKEHYHKYNTLEHYSIVYTLIDLLRDGKYHEIEDIIENNSEISKMNYGYSHVVIEYCKSLVLVNVYNDYLSAETKLLKILKINDISNIETFYPSFYGEERYFSCILLLSVILCEQDQLELSLTLITNTITFLEKNYFNDIINKSSIERYYIHIYIALLNNQADILYNLKKYENAILTCNKIQEQIVSFDSCYILEYILELKIQILYMQDLIDLAQKTYDEFVIICRLKNLSNYFISVNKKFEVSLKKLVLTDF